MLAHDGGRGGPVQKALGRPVGSLLPNLNAAICAGNAAAAWLQAGEPERSLAWALTAVAACPEYPKAHHRLVRALQAGARGTVDAIEPIGADEMLRRRLLTHREAPVGSSQRATALRFLSTPSGVAVSAGCVQHAGGGVAGAILKGELLADVQLTTQAIEAGCEPGGAPVPAGGTFGSMEKRWPSVDLALFGAGQISWASLQARQAWRLQRLLEEHRPKAVELHFALAPFEVTELRVGGGGGDGGRCLHPGSCNLPRHSRLCSDSRH